MIRVGPGMVLMLMVQSRRCCFLMVLNSVVVLVRGAAAVDGAAGVRSFIYKEIFPGETAEEHVAAAAAAAGRRKVHHGARVGLIRWLAVALAVKNVG